MDRRKIKAGRKRLKTHLKTKGEHADFEITESFCLYWWHRLNDLVFDGKLEPPVRFEIKNFRDCYGWCHAWRPNCNQKRTMIGIASNIPNRQLFLNVLGHEMIHQYEWEILSIWKPNNAHGSDFFSWRGKLKSRAGLNLQIQY